jgi:hypothetical protein
VATRLPPIDIDQVARFWSQFLAIGDLPTIGATFGPDMTAVFERFEMLFGR